MLTTHHRPCFVFRWFVFFFFCNRSVFFSTIPIAMCIWTDRYRIVKFFCFYCNFVFVSLSRFLFILFINRQLLCWTWTPFKLWKHCIHSNKLQNQTDFNMFRLTNYTRVELCASCYFRSTRSSNREGNRPKENSNRENYWNRKRLNSHWLSPIKNGTLPASVQWNAEKPRTVWHSQSANRSNFELNYFEMRFKCSDLAALIVQFVCFVRLLSFSLHRTEKFN